MLLGMAGGGLGSDAHMALLPWPNFSSRDMWSQFSRPGARGSTVTLGACVSCQFLLPTGVFP